MIPKRTRRKDSRPAEIIEAATVVFIEKGFGLTKLDDVAKRAGIAKGTLYLYFETKEDLFRAVVQNAVAVNISNAPAVFNGSLTEFVTFLLTTASKLTHTSRAPALARMVIGESIMFPDLAGIWHDNVLSRILTPLTAMIVKAQARKEVRSGDPRAYAFSIVGPLVLAILFHEVFGATSPHSPDTEVLGKQHAEIILKGLMI